MLHKVRFYLKSGASILVICQNAKIEMTGNEITRYDITGIEGEQPLYIRISEIVAVVNEGPAE